MGKTQETTLTFMDGLAFKVELGDHTFVVDSPDPKFGGKNRGPTPKSLLLPSLGGCTGMDVASILRKMQVPFDSMQIVVTGKMNDEHPIYYETMHIKYIVRGKDIPEAKVKRAVGLSQERYCGVSHMLESVARVTYEIVIEDSA